MSKSLYDEMLYLVRLRSQTNKPSLKKINFLMNYEIDTLILFCNYLL